MFAINKGTVDQVDMNYLANYKRILKKVMAFMNNNNEIKAAWKIVKRVTKISKKKDEILELRKNYTLKD